MTSCRQGVGVHDNAPQRSHSLRRTARSSWRGGGGGVATYCQIGEYLTSDVDPMPEHKEEEFI